MVPLCNCACCMDPGQCPKFIFKSGERPEIRNGIARSQVQSPGWCAGQSAGSGDFLMCSVKFPSICWLTGFLAFVLLQVNGHRSSWAGVHFAQPDSRSVHHWLTVTHSLRAAGEKRTGDTELAKEPVLLSVGTFYHILEVLVSYS